MRGPTRLRSQLQRVGRHGLTRQLPISNRSIPRLWSTEFLLQPPRPYAVAGRTTGTSSPRLIWDLLSDYEYDRFQNLDLRVVLGSGLG